MASLGKKLPRMLESMGFDTVFGIPGIHTVELYRGLPETSLRHVTPRHEQGAGFMADGYARASGRPAACFVISGPGLTNIATAMGQAYADSVPMLVISSVLNRSELGRGEGRLHELRDQGALAAGVAAFSHTVMAPDDLAPTLEWAMTVFRSARPRPVHIELPLDVIAADAADRTPNIASRSRPAPDEAAVETAARLLAEAQAPLVVLGGGVIDSAEDARALVDVLGAPTILTIAAKGVLAPDHPLLVGSLLPLAPVQEALRSADVVLAIGTELGETDTLLFDERPQIDGHLIRIDIDAEQLTRNASCRLGLVADAGTACRALARALGPAPVHDGEQTAKALRKTARGGVETSYKVHGRLLDRIASAFPGTIFAGDSTQPIYGGNLTYDAVSPRTWFNSSTGFGTLGYALPAAFGAKLACPKSPVVSIIGDGGLQFTIGELATGVELGLAVPILLWNNRGYGEIKSFMRDRRIPEIGVDIYTPDFAMIARGFGVAHTRPDTIDALIDALAGAFTADVPTIIEIDESTALNW